MSADKIIQRFQKLGYRITRDINTSNIVVIPKRGFSKSFQNYLEAYNYYFG